MGGYGGFLGVDTTVDDTCLSFVYKGVDLIIERLSQLHHKSEPSSCSSDFYMLVQKKLNTNM